MISVLPLGQALLGVLLLVALVMNIQLLRLGQRLRHTPAGAVGSLRALLLWMPVGLLAVALFGAALAEFSLLTFQHAPDTSRVSWFMLGACLMIFADVCSAFILIRLRETLHLTGGVNDLNMPPSIGTSGDTSGRANREKKAEE